MTQYLIRTNKEEKKTYVLKVDKPAENIGLIYTDFNLVSGKRDIILEDLVNPSSNKAIAQIHLYRNGNIVSVNSRKKELSAFTEKGEFKEDGMIIPYQKTPKNILLSNPEYKKLEAMGIIHAYFLGDASALSHVFCFEKGGNLSGIIYEKRADDAAALKGLSLVLAQRIENQDFIFEFIKK